RGSTPGVTTSLSRQARITSLFKRSLSSGSASFSATDKTTNPMMNQCIKRLTFCLTDHLRVYVEQPWWALARTHLDTDLIEGPRITISVYHCVTVCADNGEI